MANGHVHVYEAHDLARGVKPLTKAEVKWAERLSQILADCPSDRLALVTIGDPDLTLIDDEYRRNRDLDECGEAARQALAEIKGNPLIHGVSG